MNFANRLQKARLDKGFSKGELGNLIGIHYSQIGRYENKGALPSSDILNKMANILEVSSDFLMNGTKENFADNSLTDKELLNQFKKVELFSDSDKNVIKTLLDAFITKKQIQQLAL
jgi:transcriptional regulator with XRE-family HTH domain